MFHPNINFLIVKLDLRASFGYRVSIELIRSNNFLDSDESILLRHKASSCIRLINLSIFLLPCSFNSFTRTNRSATREHSRMANCLGSRGIITRIA